MRVIGITGGVGSGKSMAADYLGQAWQALVLKADDIGHEVLSPSGECAEEVARRFGQDILTPAGEIDRGKLAGIVYQDPEKLTWLNKVVHPAVRKRIQEAIEKYRSLCPDGLVVVESALLQEGGLESVCDEVWLIDADDETRIQRLMASRGYTPKRCRQIIDRQASRSRFLEYADRVLDNSADPDYLKRQMDSLMAQPPAKSADLL